VLRFADDDKIRFAQHANNDSERGDRLDFTMQATVDRVPLAMVLARFAPSNISATKMAPATAVRFAPESDAGMGYGRLVAGRSCTRASGCIASSTEEGSAGGRTGLSTLGNIRWA